MYKRQAAGHPDDAGLQVALSFDAAVDVAAPYVSLGTRPKVAILREQGVNSHVETSYAFDRAGFDTYDVHMTDLQSGRADLAAYQGFVACGGFSYGDTLGAGEGWARSVLFNPALAESFHEFFHRPDTFALGICNGCQMMAALADHIPGAEAWPRFTRNRSEQFEGRLSLVEVLDSPSIFFSGMAGSRIPIAVAHGEGLADFSQRGDAAAVHEAMRFVDGAGRPATAYPANPNGSPDGLTAVTTADGRVQVKRCGRVEGDQAERLDLGHAAILHRLGGLRVEPPGQLGRIGIERDQHAPVAHEAAIIGDRVIDLELVRPPIREGGAGRAVPGNLIGHFVAFQRVLEAADPHAEALHQADEHEDFILAIRVAMNPAAPLQHFTQGFEFEVAPGREGGPAGGLLPAGQVFPGGDEAVGYQRAHAHAGLGEARNKAVAPAGLLHILPQRKLDARRRGVEDEVLRAGAVAQFDDAALAPDRIGRAVEQVHDCLLYTSDAADDLLCVDLGGRRIITKKKYQQTTNSRI